MRKLKNMRFDRYYTGIIIRVIAITLSALLLAFLYFATNYLYSIFVLIIVVTVETWTLIRFIMKRRDDITRMLEHIKENNPSLYFSQSRVYPFRELNDFLNEIGEIVRQVRIDKESNLQYMNFIIQHAETGLLAFDKDGNVEVINQAAKDLFGLSEIKAISNLDVAQRGLPEMLTKLRAGEQKIISMKSSGRLIQLSVRASVFKIGKKEVRLLSLQDIKNEMDEKEMEAWQKLIRILTHEIINSITPVTSLTTAISGLFLKAGRQIPRDELDDGTISEALTGLGYIEERGKNLIGFVNKYRSLTKLPVPKFEETDLSMLINGVIHLKHGEINTGAIELTFMPSPERIMINCDKSLIEHVLINLVNNAKDAILARKNNSGGRIEIKTILSAENYPEILVSDDGTGIPDEILENIFIPFFTTRENGSGIGLSLSRQIMRLHGGTISIVSTSTEGSVFSLKFQSQIPGNKTSD
jgi:two-component system, NtrC family, nitrogen regulation sensor histidine kinase NtrY